MKVFSHSLDWTDNEYGLDQLKVDGGKQFANLYRQGGIAYGKGLSTYYSIYMVTIFWYVPGRMAW